MSRTIDLPITSRLSATPLLQDGDTNDYFYGVWGKIEFPVDSRDVTHTVTNRDVHNWAKLADEAYGDFTKMWVIWAANKITDPLQVEVGTRIRIPADVVVNSVLSNITKDAE